MTTAVAKHEDIDIVGFDADPADVAEAARARSAKRFYIAFDLQEDRLKSAQVIDWVERFRRHYYEAAPQQREVARVLPSILVFANHFSAQEAQQLRDLGMVLFDRSLASNADCKTVDQWFERHAKSLSALSRFVADPVAVPAVEPDLAILNSDALGLPADLVDEHLRKLNERAD